MTKDSEIRIILDPAGLKKIELYGQENDAQSEETTLETYGILAVIIHQFGAKAKAILSKNTVKK